MAWRNPIRVALLALAVALVQVQAQQNLDKPLLTIPLHKDGEQYALLDFFSADPAHIRATTDQFCDDHGFSEADRQMIIRHATAEISKVQRTATHQRRVELQVLELILVVPADWLDQRLLFHWAASHGHWLVLSG